MRRALLLALALLGGCVEVVDLGRATPIDAGPPDAPWIEVDAAWPYDATWPDAGFEVDAAPPDASL
jgi:hypothetical protein